jgi:outer membrane protein assembly factor BamB
MRLGKRYGAVTLMVLLSVGMAFATGVTETLSPAIGPPTTNVQVSGAGFPASTAVDIYFDTTDEVLAVTSATGTFSGIVVKVPASAVPGAHWITAVARGTSGKAAQAAFTVQTNWTQDRYSPLHRSVNPFENVLSPSSVGTLDLDWFFATGGQIISAPAVANGMVYFGSGDDNLYAISAATGGLVWKFTTGNRIFFSSPAVANGIVYIGSNDNNLYAINATTGVLVWKFTTGSTVRTAPTVANGIVYFGSDDANIYALDASTGTQVWKFTTGGAVAGSAAAVANGVVYVGSFSDFNLYAINASTGTLLWKFPTLGNIDSSPTVSNGIVYFGSQDKNVYAVNARTGVLRWKFLTGFVVESSPAVASGVVYIGSDDGNLYALAASNGTQLWKYTTGAQVYSGPSVANGVVYFGSADQNVYAVNAQNGALLWQAATGNTVAFGPTVVNGTVYACSYDNNLYAFDLAASTMSAKFRPPARPEPASLRPDFTLTPYVGGKTIRR